MYSLILMTAMAGTPDTTEFNGFFRNLFSFGGCSGSCSGTGSGSSRLSGCTGSGSCHGREFGSRLRAFNGSCNGRSASASGSCTGRGYACSGSSLSCTGYAASCQGGVDRGTPWFDDYARPGPAMSQFAPSGSCQGFGHSLGVPMPFNETPLFDAPARPFAAEPPATIPEDRTGRRIALSSPNFTGVGRATVIVRLPADAALYAEGQRLALTSAERSFVTPILPTNDEYSYAFRVEYTRNGETISQTKKVGVRAGTTTTVEFGDLTQVRANRGGPDVTSTKPNPIPLATSTPVTTAAAELTSKTHQVPGLSSPLANADRARITVKLPPGATLYVDGKKNERSDPIREFSTPPIPTGQEYAYLMKAEVMRNGQPETQTTKVSFRAGEIVSVDFTAPPK